MKGFLADQLGHFSPYDVPVLLFEVLFAALLGYIVGRFGARAGAREVRQLAVWAALGALTFGLVKGQLPFAVGALALVVLLRSPTDAMPPRLPLFAALLLGMGCGMNAAAVAGLAAIPVVLLLRWAFSGRTAG